MVIDPITGKTDALSTLGQILAGLDSQENRLRTNHASRLKDLAAMGLQRRGELNSGLSAQGMLHSGANLDAQSQLGSQIDRMRADTEQSFADRLADIARQRLSLEGNYKISSLIPR